ncbi:MAG: imidazole glycerol phosphate synthase subunit HisH [Bacteroidales bacterium]|nr:imidazole glycerol phosphate synthase subunit HisH [Bacteroidales bacterium]
MKIVIIDYGAGNIQSLRFALKRLGYKPELSSNPEKIRHADRVIFPGVGEASSAMNKLKNSGLDELIPTLKQPVLGICLGMQLMCESSEEGDTKGLGIFSVRVRKFENKHKKVPQIGWNEIIDLKTGLFKGVRENEFMYFVHSYYVPDNRWSIAKTNYGINYASSIQKDNFTGCQFHPEKSSLPGEKILNNFLLQNKLS